MLIVNGPSRPLPREPDQGGVRPEKMDPWRFWIMQTIRYSRDPNPANFTLRELGFIWLYSTCLYECFDENIMGDIDWDWLTKWLVNEHQYFDAPMRWMIPYSCLTSSTAVGLEWNKECRLVIEGCEQYMLEKESRRKAG